MKKDNSQVHVRIDEPTQLRRNILEGAIEAAEALKIYERFKAVRRNKIKQKKELKDILKTLREVLDSFDNSLPKIEYGKKPKPMKVVTPKQLNKQRLMPEPIKEEPKTKLELDLEDIKRKLDRL